MFTEVPEFPGSVKDSSEICHQEFILKQVNLVLCKTNIYQYPVFLEPMDS